MAERNLDFDRIVNRKNSRCLKYDFAAKRGYPEDILPLWVADMDFATTSYVEDALIKLAHHNIYGYTNTQENDGFFEAVSGWMLRQHNWEVKYEWHVKTPGVTLAIANAIRAYTNPGDSVIINQPVYYPFTNIIKQNGRNMVTSDLREDENGHYSIDFDDFENKIIENSVKLYILCNPHNPVGRVWTRDELETLGNICKKHNVIVFSDEIHSDFVWRGEHQVFQEVSEEFKEFTITATAPSKTFNLAGLQQSNLFISNDKLRSAFLEALEITGIDEPNVTGIVASEAAYSHGEEWYNAMKEYVRANMDYVIAYINENLPKLKVSDPEGTYLMWIDFRGLGLAEKELEDLIVNKAGLWLDAGAIFGKSGIGFERINVACPRKILTEALERIKAAIG